MNIKESLLVSLHKLDDEKKTACEKVKEAESALFMLRQDVDRLDMLRGTLTSKIGNIEAAEAMLEQAYREAEGSYEPAAPTLEVPYSVESPVQIRRESVVVTVPNEHNEPVDYYRTEHPMKIADAVRIYMFGLPEIHMNVPKIASRIQHYWPHLIEDRDMEKFKVIVYGALDREAKKGNFRTMHIGGMLHYKALSKG